MNKRVRSASLLVKSVFFFAGTLLGFNLIHTDINDSISIFGVNQANADTTSSGSGSGGGTTVECGGESASCNGGGNGGNGGCAGSDASNCGCCSCVSCGAQTIESGKQ